MVAVGLKGRPWLSVEPDKRYGLGYVDTGFSVPYDFPQNREMLVAAAADTVNKTIEQCERIGKFKFVDRIPITYKLSSLPSQSEIDRFTGRSSYSLFSHRDNTDRGGAAVPVASINKPEIGFVARLWFIKPLDVVNLDEDAESSQLADGFVAPEEMPKEYLNGN